MTCLWWYTRALTPEQRIQLRVYLKSLAEATYLLRPFDEPCIDSIVMMEMSKLNLKRLEDARTRLAAARELRKDCLRLRVPKAVLNRAAAARVREYRSSARILKVYVQAQFWSSIYYLR